MRVLAILKCGELAFNLSRSNGFDITAICSRDRSSVTYVDENERDWMTRVDDSLEHYGPDVAFYKGETLVWTPPSKKMYLKTSVRYMPERVRAICGRFGEYELTYRRGTSLIESFSWELS